MKPAKNSGNKKSDLSPIEHPIKKNGQTSEVDSSGSANSTGGSREGNAGHLSDGGGNVGRR